MSNKYRLKVIYKDTRVTLDIAEDITFDELSTFINEKISLVDSKAYKYLKDGEVIISNKDDKNKKLCDVLELDEKLVYVIGNGVKAYSINVIVWDYLIETDNKTIEKFNRLVKKVKQARPVQVYYLNNKQRKFIDNLLADCYEALREINFSGIYNFHLLKNNENYLATKVIYYILDDKYEIHLYNNLEDLENDKVEYLVTFYDTNRAYFKGYQGKNRNIFILHGEDTIRKADFEYVYSALNQIIYMLKDLSDDILFVSHEKCLNYDIASRKIINDETER